MTTSWTLNDLVLFLQEYASKHRRTKELIAKATAENFGLSKKRSVYSCSSFAVRFSTASTPSFSNVVLSLSALQAYDHLPFVVCIVRPNGIELLLANSTFLKKISHSSHQLRTDNVRGSFLGHDIMREYDGVKNAPPAFEELFAIHSAFTWEERLARLVEATNNISPTGTRFAPTSIQIENILSTASLAAKLSSHTEYSSIANQLSKIVETQRSGILKAALIDNVNERGNKIEQLITEGVNVHSLEDLKYTLQFGATVIVDVKTKLMSLSSSPKAYNIDKVLITLSQGNTAFSFFFVGIDHLGQSLSTRLVSILDRTIISATRIQFHWAGRNSRGVTQLTGDLSGLFSPTFREHVDIGEAEQFLQRLIDL